MKQLYIPATLLFVLALVLAAPAKISAQWATWDAMVNEAMSVPHSTTRVCKSGTCTTTIVVEADGHKAIMKRIVGQGIDRKLMCKDDLPCIPW